MMRILLACCMVLALSCARFAVAHVVAPCSKPEIDEAMRLAQSHPQGANFEIDMRIVRVGDGSGREKGSIFLDSEENFRTPCSLNIRIFPAAAAELKTLHGEGFFEALTGRIAHARGTVIRVPITIRQPQTGSARYFYYQTQLFVRATDDLRIVSDVQDSSTVSEAKRRTP